MHIDESDALSSDLVVEKLYSPDKVPIHPHTRTAGKTIFQRPPDPDPAFLPTLAGCANSQDDTNSQTDDPVPMDDGATPQAGGVAALAPSNHLQEPSASQSQTEAESVDDVRTASAGQLGGKTVLTWPNPLHEPDDSQSQMTVDSSQEEERVLGPGQIGGKTVAAWSNHPQELSASQLSAADADADVDMAHVENEDGSDEEDSDEDEADEDEGTVPDPSEDIVVRLVSQHILRR